MQIKENLRTNYILFTKPSYFLTRGRFNYVEVSCICHQQCTLYIVFTNKKLTKHVLIFSLFPIFVELSLYACVAASLSLELRGHPEEKKNTAIKIVWWWTAHATRSNEWQRVVTLTLPTPNPTQKTPPPPPPPPQYFIYEGATYNPGIISAL
jgi:hypothetical protein